MIAAFNPGPYSIPSLPRFTLNIPASKKSARLLDGRVQVPAIARLRLLQPHLLLTVLLMHFGKGPVWRDGE